MRKGLLIVLLSLGWNFLAFGQSDPCKVPLKASQQELFDKALKQYQEGHYEQCNESLKRLAAKAPKSADVQFWLGMCAVKRDNNPAAIRRYFTKLLSLCPDYPDARAHFYMGVVYYSDDRFDEAVAELNRYFAIVNTPPSDADAQQAVEQAQRLYEEASNYLYWSQFLADAYRNQAPFNPRVLLGVSSREDEFLPYISPDGRDCYYLRTIPERDGYSFYAKSNVKKNLRLCVSHWKDTTFSEGDVLDVPFNQQQGEGGVTLTADGRTLYYSVLNRTSRDYANVDVFGSRLVNGRWSPLFSAGPNVNGDRSWDSQPSITPDGQYLYFASNRPGGLGGMDIWRCRRLPNGDWSRAENLGPSVNTPGNEKCPFIHADGKTLYFASNGWQGFGGYDMYFININDTYLQRPTNMGLPINGEGDDICFGVTVDGQQAYYAAVPTSIPGAGGSDVMTFSLYPAARPEPMRHFWGSATSAEGTPIPAQIHHWRPDANTACYWADSSDGRFAVQLSMQADNLLAVIAEGFMPQIVTYSAQQVKRGMQPLDFSLVPMSLKRSAPLPSNNLAKPLRDKWLDVLTEFLQQHPRLHIDIESPKSGDAKRLYEELLSRKLRPERLSFRGGTDIASPRWTITQMP